MNNASFALPGPRDSVLVAKWCQLILSTLGLTFSLFLMVMHLWSVRRKTLKEMLKVGNRWRIYIFFTCMSAFIASLLVLLLSVVSWNAANISRCIIIPNYIAVFFVIMRQFSGLTLWSRALVVHEGLRLGSFKLRLFRIVIYGSITIGVWVIFGW